MEMADWVSSLGPWDVIAHLTWRDFMDKRGNSHGISMERAAAGYERFMSKHLRHLSYFYAVEQNPSRDGYHVHALWGDARSVFRKGAWSQWHREHGRARIEPVKSRENVTDYCSKYVTKEGAWWNVKLQWHRARALVGKEFRLE